MVSPSVLRNYVDVRGQAYAGPRAAGHFYENCSFAEAGPLWTQVDHTNQNIAVFQGRGDLTMLWVRLKLYRILVCTTKVNGAFLAI